MGGVNAFGNYLTAEIVQITTEGVVFFRRGRDLSAERAVGGVSHAILSKLAGSTGRLKI